MRSDEYKQAVRRKSHDGNPHEPHRQPPPAKARKGRVDSNGSTTGQMNRKGVHTSPSHFRQIHSTMSSPANSTIVQPLFHGRQTVSRRSTCDLGGTEPTS